MAAPELDNLLRPAAELLHECLDKDATPRQMERATMMLERCWRSWKREMEGRLFFPTYPQDDWPFHIDREAIDAASDGGPVSLFEAAILIGDRVSHLAASMVTKAPELFTCAWARGEIDPRCPSTLVKYSDHPGEVPDLSWVLYPEEVDAFALERWGETIFARSDPEPVTTEDSANAGSSEPDQEEEDKPTKTSRSTGHRTLYDIIRALALALAETNPEKFKKPDGSLRIGYGKDTKNKDSGIAGHLRREGFSKFSAGTLGEHISKAIREDWS